MMATKTATEYLTLAEIAPAEYPKYDNYDAIEVSKTANIPMDYDGVMGVPLAVVSLSPCLAPAYLDI
jgi:hypothetical protein